MGSTSPDFASTRSVKFDTTAMLLARRRAGLTQAGVARKLDLTVRAVQRWENGTGVPSGKNLLRLAELLEIPTNELYVMERVPA